MIHNLLFHGIVAIIFIAVGVLSLRNIDLIETDIVVGTYIRVADNVKLQGMLALRQRELEFDREVSVDRNPLDDQELLG